MFERTRTSRIPSAIVTAKHRQVADTLRSAKRKVSKQSSTIKKAARRTSSRYGTSRSIGWKRGNMGDAYQEIVEGQLSDDEKAVATFLAPDALNSLDSDDHVEI
mmetsp:Transcript_22539/g.46771  ORF Transcript_22539/g.46771 Transcript_22539/m.46771 type:complete len:104 (+) Transcript_22539:2069-2380(+)